MSEDNTDGGVKHCGFVRRNIFFWIGLIFIYGFILFMCFSIYEDDLNGTASAETASAETANTETVSAETASTETAGKESDAVVYTGSSDGFYAVDSSGVLSDETVSFIDEQGRALCDSTKAQIVVVIVPNTGDDSLFDYSMNLFKENGYGDSKLDNGVLLLVTTDEVHARLTTGYGLEGCLPDGKCGRILDTYTMDALKSGDYDKAVTDTWKAVAATVYEEYGKEVPSEVKIDTSETAETAEDDTSVAEDTSEETAEPVTIEFVIKKSIIAWIITALILLLGRWICREKSQYNPYKGWVWRWIKMIFAGIWWLIVVSFEYGGGGDGGGGGSSGGGGAER